ncbi:glycogen synthase [Chitinophaga pendula]|uniref:glycogen synthase n=1 Tax=Chitinophaga TaxID=79328 RepID=UPI000BB065D7|nr:MULTISPECIES: glycogen synthase [Chitinophaga]ASZ12422.1 glycogen synthase [Chitinophaga sp. MD30]UCJ09981.1 glycogen synthase [Chitinophaga pendula]
MEILHVSAECYPIAKVGGLGDVVGALPKYQYQEGAIAKVVMPAYKTRYFETHEFDIVHQAGMWMGHDWYHFNIWKEQENTLGFDLYLVDIPGLLDKEGVYGHFNDTERFLAFQIAVLDWVNEWQHQPDVIHCHDHQTGLIPFLLSYGYKYQRLQSVASVITIHNAQYQGQFGWDKLYLLPGFDLWKSGMLDWNGAINPLAAAIKCAWKVTTVSPSYMEELYTAANGLESLLSAERGKAVGILNGIDSKIWDPGTDPMIPVHYSLKNFEQGKLENKLRLCETFGFNPQLPLISFIGRLVGEKGADLLPEIIGRSLYEQRHRLNFLVLGSGDQQTEWALQQTRYYNKEHFNVQIGYNEALSHQIYAGSDFLLMPSRVEPCGLNQLYALRYGTIPMVRSVGGLKDTVIDFGDEDGTGIRFVHASVPDACHAVSRALELYQDPEQLQGIRRYAMGLDHSWDVSAAQYLALYRSMH